jgi:hypothetical protein
MVKDFWNRLILRYNERLKNGDIVPLSKIVSTAAKVCASAGALGIGLKLYVSFSKAFLLNKVIVLPINPNIWDATFLIISGLTLTVIQLKDTLKWKNKRMKR